ncbi:MAG: indole-3-glycerol phosphate synthase TrpC [Ginsengibacter sp.]
MNILDKIIASKKAEVSERQKSIPLKKLERTEFFSTPTRSFKDSLLNPEKTGIITEFKRQSPSKGIINHTSTVKEVTGDYTKYGASALSVLTDEVFFGGSMQDFDIARENDIPLLRKEFIIDEYQLVESKAHGADIILLIAACLGVKEANHLAKFAKNLGLNVLLEIHHEKELEHICPNVDVVGVNNRNLKDFKVDINHSIELGNQIPEGKIKIAESGIHDMETLLLLRDHGFQGFLIGEKFMKETDPGKAFKEFVKGLKK